MIRALRRDPPEPESAEAGFTLIELLVVIIIIGILAAIAVPIFLNQRSRATDASIMGDLRLIAEFEETYYTSEFTYGTIPQLIADGSDVRVSPTVTVRILHYDTESFCLEGVSTQSDDAWYYDNAGGGLQERGAAGCPVTTGAVAGGSVTNNGPP